MPSASQGNSTDVAFQNSVTPAFYIRLAIAEDAAAACGVIRDSISQLCVIDHRDDDEHLQKWLSNKTPENVRRWIAQFHFFVAVRGSDVVGVAAMDDDGKVKLNYVAPSARFQGISKALMAKIEETAKSLGIALCRLESTQTALTFYESLGFEKSPETYVLPLTGDKALVMTKRL